MAGIARPQRFFAALRQQGWEVVDELVFRDHHWFTARDLVRVAAAARRAGADFVMTTEKDAMRLAWRDGVRAMGVSADARRDRARRDVCRLDPGAPRAGANATASAARGSNGREMTAGIAWTTRLRHAAEYLLVRGVATIVRLLPMRTVRRGGEALGRLAGRVSGSRRRIALDNLAHAFPGSSPAEREAIVARRCSRTSAALLLELIKFGA